MAALHSETWNFWERMRKKHFKGQIRYLNHKKVSLEIDEDDNIIILGKCFKLRENWEKDWVFACFFTEKWQKL